MKPQANIIDLGKVAAGLSLGLCLACPAPSALAHGGASWPTAPYGTGLTPAAPQSSIQAQPAFIQTQPSFLYPSPPAAPASQAFGGHRGQAWRGQEHGSHEWHEHDRREQDTYHRHRN